MVEPDFHSRVTAPLPGAFMNKIVEYRKLALEALEQSARTSEQEHRDAWLLISQGWMQLHAEHERAQNSLKLALKLAFETGVQANGISQKKSGAPH
jgi:hypothetical protein